MWKRRVQARLFCVLHSGIKYSRLNLNQDKAGEWGIDSNLVHYNSLYFQTASMLTIEAV